MKNRASVIARYAEEDAFPFTWAGGVAGGFAVELDAATVSGVLLRVKDEVSVSSSGIVANFFKTCLRAGRRMGLLDESQRTVYNTSDLSGEGNS